jgi:hypothetical protein
LTPAAEITAAGNSNYPKNRSQAAPPPILDALFAPALKAFPVSGLQCLNLPMNNASLHLAEHGFAFFKAETDLFRPDSCGFSLHLSHYLPMQNAACETCLDPNPKFHQQPFYAKNQARSGNGSPATHFSYLDGRTPMFDTVPDNRMAVP